ncbi:MAG TPA: VOC family protein [Burkholderiales bacterium]
MESGLITSLRSVEMGLPDLTQARAFYVDTWRLKVAAETADAVYLRASGADCHVIALCKSAQPELRSVTFRASSAAALDTLAERAKDNGGSVVTPRAAVLEHGGGEAVTIRDPQGRILRFVHGDTRNADAAERRDEPIRLAHAVMNSHDTAAAQPFYEALGFKLSDRTRIMAFLRIPTQPRGDHHSVALADADNDCLNHVAFLMPDLESVMRGGGRLKDAGYAIEWGPGRHGPGDNAFNYFVGPGRFVIEYTAEVEQVDDSYQVGRPEDWKWPAGRVDHWGISQPPSANLKEAQRVIRFAGSVK